jgi:phosphatidylserine synthase
MIATMFLFGRFLGAADTVKHIAILVLVCLLSYLMVSNFRYLSFKHPETSKAKTFQVLVGMVLLFISCGHRAAGHPIRAWDSLCFIRSVGQCVPIAA